MVALTRSVAPCPVGLSFFQVLKLEGDPLMLTPIPRAAQSAKTWSFSLGAETLARLEAPLRPTMARAPQIAAIQIREFRPRALKDMYITPIFGCHAPVGAVESRCYTEGHSPGLKTL